MTHPEHTKGFCDGVEQLIRRLAQNNVTISLDAVMDILGDIAITGGDATKVIDVARRFAPELGLTEAWSQHDAKIRVWQTQRKALT